jgi:hypothetical protein
VRRTATSEQVAAALHVKPATVRKYAREHRLPYDTTPGGHRRFDVAEAVAAVLGSAVPGSGRTTPDVAALVRVLPASSVAVTAVARVRPARVVVRDAATAFEDWAVEVPVV